MNRLAYVFLIALAACHESTAPFTNAALRGDYVLASVNGKGLPANVADAANPIMLLGDTIHFDGVYTATRHWTLRDPSSTQQAPSTKLFETVYYDVTRMSVSFAACPPGAACRVCPDACAYFGPDSGQIVLGLSRLFLYYQGAKYFYQKAR